MRQFVALYAAAPVKKLIDPKSVGFFRESSAQSPASISHRPDFSRIIPMTTRIFRVLPISSRRLGQAAGPAHNYVEPYRRRPVNPGNLMAIKFICQRLTNNPGIPPQCRTPGRRHRK